METESTAARLSSDASPFGRYLAGYLSYSNRTTELVRELTSGR